MRMHYRLDQVKIYRGMKEIAKFMGISPRSVRSLIDDYGLPVVKEGKLIFTLSNIDYYEWREKMRKENTEGEKNPHP